MTNTPSRFRIGLRNLNRRRDRCQNHRRDRHRIHYDARLLWGLRRRRPNELAGICRLLKQVIQYDEQFDEWCMEQRFAQIHAPVERDRFIKP